MTNGEEPINGYLDQRSVTNSFGNTETIRGQFGGLTKREYFSSQALKGLLSNSNILKFFQRDGLTPGQFIELVAKDSTVIADTLIKALNDKP